MSLVVQKYGGTSVGSPERICAVADRIAEAYKQGQRMAVVVSAMGDTTDELIDLAKQVAKNPPHREMDMLLTVGERISMALLSMALAERKVPAVSFTGSQSGIITDDSHRRARIQRILGTRVRDALAEEKVAIVAGFQGVSESKEITTLGRGGSDTTAVALAAALKADRCEIFTDVDGVFTADPRIAPGAKLLEKISADLMIEMSTRGAGVLHPRSVELAKQFGVKLWVRNSLRADCPGTEIVPTMENHRITAVASDASKALLYVQLMRPTAISALWDFARAKHLSVLSPFFAEGEVRFFIERDAIPEWRQGLDALSVDGFIQKVWIEENMVPLSVIGERFSQDGAALQEVIEVLAQNHISVTMGSASALAITVAVRQNQMDDGVKALHDRFLT